VKPHALLLTAVTGVVGQLAVGVNAAHAHKVAVQQALAQFEASAAAARAAFTQGAAEARAAVEERLAREEASMVKLHAERNKLLRSQLHEAVVSAQQAQAAATVCGTALASPSPAALASALTAASLVLPAVASSFGGIACPTVYTVSLDVASLKVQLRGLVSLVAEPVDAAKSRVDGPGTATFTTTAARASQVNVLHVTARGTADNVVGLVSDDIVLSVAGVATAAAGGSVAVPAVVTAADDGSVAVVYTVPDLVAAAADIELSVAVRGVAFGPWTVDNLVRDCCCG
jgi:hypothetical protein